MLAPATGATAFSSDACSPRFGWKRSAGSLDRAMTSGVYVAVLSRKSASPVPPESDEEDE